MKRNLILKIISFVLGIAGVVLGFLVKFNFEATDGVVSKFAEPWGLFDQVSKGNRTTMALYGVSYDNELKGLAVFLLVLLAISVVVLVGLAIYNLATKEKSLYTTFFDDVFSIVTVLLSGGFLATVLSYMSKNTIKGAVITSGIVVSNLAVFILAISLTMLSGIIYFVSERIKPKKK